MIIVEDTRQQSGKHEAKNAYFKSNGIKVVRSKLFVGDYTRLDNQTVAIDSKQSFLELSMDICGKQHERFREECKRAQECNITLYILVEEIPPDGKVANWHSPRTKVKGEVLEKCMRTMKERYGVQLVFCDKAHAGKVIIDILGKTDNKGV